MSGNQNKLLLAVAAIGLCASAFILYLSYDTSKKVQQKRRDTEIAKKALAASKEESIKDDKPAKTRKSDQKTETVSPSTDLPTTPSTASPKNTNRGKESSVKGIAHYKKGEFEEAIECYTEAIDHLKLNRSTPPKDLCTVFHNRAAAYLQLKDYENVVKDCTEALQADRVHTKSRQKRAKANQALGNLREALNDRLAIMVYMQLSGTLPDKTSETEVEDLVKVIAKDEAKRILKQREDVVHPLPSETVINSYFSSFQHRGHDFPGDTVESLSEQLNNDIPEAEKGTLFYRRAHLHKKNKDFTKAVDDLKCAKDCGEQEYEASILNEYGTFLHLQGNLTEARTCLEKSSTLDPNNANVWIKLAGIAFDSEDRGTAQTLFDRAVQVDSKDPDVYFHRGQMWMLLEKCDDALEDIKKCVEICPSAHGHMQLGIALFRVEKVEESIQELKRAVEMNPSLPSVWNTLGEVMMTTAAQATSVEEAEKKFAEAMTHLDKATEVDPNFPDAYVAKGQLKLQKLQMIQQGQEEAQKAVKEVEQLFEKAIEVDEQCKEAYLHAAQLALQTNHSDKMKDYFQSAIKWAKTEAELQHICQEHESALSQLAAAQSLKLG